MKNEVSPHDLRQMSSWNLLSTDMPYLRVQKNENGQHEIPMRNKAYVKHLRALRIAPAGSKEQRRYQEIKQTHRLVTHMLCYITDTDYTEHFAFTVAVKKINAAVTDEQTRTRYEERLNDLLNSRYGISNVTEKMPNASAIADEVREDLRAILHELADKERLTIAMASYAEHFSGIDNGHPYFDQPDALATIMYLIHYYSQYQETPKSIRTMYQAIETCCNQRYSPKTRKEALPKLVSIDESIRDSLNANRDAGGLYELLLAIDLNGVWQDALHPDEISTAKYFAIHDEVTGLVREVSFDKNTLYPLSGELLLWHPMPARIMRLEDPTPTESSGRVKLRKRGLTKSGIKNGRPNRDYEGYKVIVPEAKDLITSVQKIWSAVSAKYPDSKICIGPEYDHTDFTYQQNIFSEGIVLGQTRIPYTENALNPSTSDMRKAVKFLVEIKGKIVELQFQTIAGHLNCTYGYDRTKNPEFHDGYFLTKMMERFFSKIMDQEYFQIIQSLSNIPNERKIRQVNGYLTRLLLEMAHYDTWNGAKRRRVLM